MANTIAVGRSYEITRSTIAKTCWEITGDEWTVGEMLTFVISDKKRHHFRFDVASGSGCADWCVTVLGDIEEAGKLSGGVKKAAEEFVDNTAREVNDERGMPLPTPKGIFYD